MRKRKKLSHKMKLERAIFYDKEWIDRMKQDGVREDLISIIERRCEEYTKQHREIVERERTELADRLKMSNLSI